MGEAPDMNVQNAPGASQHHVKHDLPPVDLFSFYIYMRDQQRSVDYLDFWSAPPREDKRTFH